MKEFQKLTVSACLLAIGLVLPLLTGQIPTLGNMLLPMHIPVLICGFLCGWKYGLAVGFIAPLLRSLLFGMPVLYPTAVSMAFEMAAYGSVSGFLFIKAKSVSLRSVYCCLIFTMLTGRAVFGIAQMILTGIKGNSFTFTAFISGAFLNAIPGIIIQLIFIPAFITVLYKSNVVSYEKFSDAKHG